MRPKSSSLKLVDHLERAKESADALADLAKRDRRLLDYDDTEESTARHQMPEQHFHFAVNAGTPSQPDLKLEGEVEIGPVKVRGLPRWAVLLAIPAAAAVTGLVSWLLAR